MLRLWSSESITDFHGLKGKLNYLKRFGALRGLDLLGVITFNTFVCLQEIQEGIAIPIRLLHVIQTLQIYRLIFPLLKLMISTIMVQFTQLYIATVVASIIFVLMSFSIYLKEMENIGILDSFWFTYITLTTIGFVLYCILYLILN
jgi:hypothetical protein